jgi:hypothetical protein
VPCQSGAFDPSPTSNVRRSIRDNVNFGKGKEQSYRDHVGERYSIASSAMANTPGGRSPPTPKTIVAVAALPRVTLAWCRV